MCGHVLYLRNVNEYSKYVHIIKGRTNQDTFLQKMFNCSLSDHNTLCIVQRSILLLYTCYVLQSHTKYEYKELSTNVEHVVKVVPIPTNIDLLYFNKVHHEDYLSVFQFYDSNPETMCFET